MHRKLILAATAVAAFGVAAPAADAAFPGQNGPILYGNGYEGGAGIFSITPGGTPSLLIGTNDIGTPDGVDVTADGKRIAYNRADYTIWVAGADGTGSTNITPEDREDYGPSWSPDGTRIAFASADRGDDDDNFTLWTMNADGTDRRQVLDDGEPIYGMDPAWSPDGTAIAFTDYSPWVTRGITTAIAITDPEGEHGVEFLTPGNDPEWTPDGASIVHRDTIFGHGELHRYDVESDESEQLTSDEDEFRYADPSLSPDGTKIVADFERDDPRRGGTIFYGLATLNADGSGTTVLAGTRGGSGAEWTPASVKTQQQPKPQILPPLPQQDASVRAAVPSQARTCGSRRYFTINLRGKRLKGVRVLVNGKRITAERNGRNYRVKVDLRKLPKGTFAVKIRKTLKSGRVATETRRYRTCVPKPRS